jgi:hypothetical protein
MLKPLQFAALFALLFAITALVTGCPTPGTTCDENSVIVQNESGMAATISFEPRAAAGSTMGPTVTEMLADDTVLGTTVLLPAGSYRVRVVTTDTNTVIYDSNIMGNHLIVEGCSTTALVSIPSPEPQPMCVAGGTIGPWSRIDLRPIELSAGGTRPQVCIGSNIYAEARDACGNLVSTVNEPAIWLRSNGSDTTLMAGLSAEDVNFHNGIASVRVNATRTAATSIAASGGGFVSSVTNLTFSEDPVILYVLPDPVRFAGTDVFFCLGVRTGVPTVRVITASGCGAPTAPALPITVRITAESGVFAPTELNLTPENSGNASFFLPFVPGGVTTDTFSASGGGLMSPPLSVIYDRGC